MILSLTAIALSVLLPTPKEPYSIDQLVDIFNGNKDLIQSLTSKAHLQTTDSCSTYYRSLPQQQSLKSLKKQPLQKSNAFKSPFRKVTTPCKALATATKPDQLETVNRNLKLLITHKENNESQKLDALISKWKVASRDALLQLQQLIGPMIVESAPSNKRHATCAFHQETGWDSEKGLKFARVFGEAMMGGVSMPTLKGGVVDLDDIIEEIESGRQDDGDDEGEESIEESRSERVLTLKEICGRLQIDVDLLGKYIEEMDAYEE